MFVGTICLSRFCINISLYYEQDPDTSTDTQAAASTRRPPPIFLTSPRAQYLKSMGWIPPKSTGYNEVTEPPPSPPSTYNAQPTTQQHTMTRIFKKHKLTLFSIRTVQCVLAVAYFILLAYSACHHGWWMMSNLSMPLGFGCKCSPTYPNDPLTTHQTTTTTHPTPSANPPQSQLTPPPPVSAALLTIPASLPTFLNHNSPQSHTRTRAQRAILHFSRTILEWVLIGFWSAAFITMLLNKGKDFKLLFDKPPYTEWIVAAVLAAIEM